MMKELKEDIRGIVKYNTLVTEEDLTNMKYLQAVIKETLRLHPSVPVQPFRENSEDVTIDDYDIEANTRVLVNIWAIHRDPECWDEPDEFRPERFLNSSVDFRGQDYEFIPFGGGRRGCPGISYAVANAELVLANLVSEFDCKLPGGAKVESLDTSEGVGFTLKPLHPLLVIATPSG